MSNNLTGFLLWSFWRYLKSYGFLGRGFCFFHFGRAGDQTQGLTYTRQLLYTWGIHLVLIFSDHANSTVILQIFTKDVFKCLTSSLCQLDFFFFLTCTCVYVQRYMCVLVKAREQPLVSSSKTSLYISLLWSSSLRLDKQEALGILLSLPL